MKRSGIINRKIARIIAEMGHTDRITICDCGFPIPDGAEVVDLSITKGFPRLIDVLRALREELIIEKIILAKEIVDKNPEMHNLVLELFSNTAVEYVEHSEFKKIAAADSKAFIRTGEATPYSNVILSSGVDF
ncbi:D-ribose pyranase [Kosmotoga pacifica]|uniref:D-ribose pyranase n=1 Tax=Kosmotoga pacifica TaxID=1330330 RepID=A0A0G2ZDP5_9BACT|nr:D-ribose pyranase [Kosmotoga pacifica]AKI97664.1 ribose pyranase [Kosmotoga pacifica]